MSGRRRMKCSWKDIESRGPSGVNRDALRVTCWKPLKKVSCLASLSVRPCLSREQQPLFEMCRQDSLRRHYVLECSLHIHVLLRGNLYGYA